MTLPPLDKAHFTYILSDQPYENFSKHYSFFGRVLSVSEKTDCFIGQDADRVLCIVGLCVDSHGELNRRDIPHWLLNRARSIDDLVRMSNRLAGRYIILFQTGADVYALTDAAAMMNIYYALGRICLSSSEKLIADVLGLKVSDRSKRIRKGSNAPSLAMPNDTSMFDEIKFLLPNHYLALPDKASRYFPKNRKARSLNAQEAAQKIAPLLSNISSEYVKYQSIACPLTAGWDSRLVFANLYKASPGLMCYTFIRNDAADLDVPDALHKALGFRYRQVEEKNAPKEYADALRERAGGWTADEPINSAYAFHSNFQDMAYSGGAIIDQIGSFTMGRGLPEFFARPSFFVSRLRNYSREAQHEMYTWARNARKESGDVSLFDLYAWESRCGRWVTQTIMVQALAALPYVNIFNCREVIELMISVPRKQRFSMQLHKALYRQIDPALLNHPFNPHKRKIARIKRTPHYSLCAIYGGYLLRLVRYRMRNRS